MARIVIVEDDRDIRELIALILEEDGHTSVATATGPEALQECGHAVPDLVLLDVSLPGELSGLEVCRRLRSDERMTDVPIMLLTARARTSDVEAGYAAGANDYLVKPFSPDELLRRIEDLLGPAGR